MIKIITIILFFSSFVFSIHHYTFTRKLEHSNLQISSDDASELWFDQKLDHFHYNNKKIWKQRYFINKEFYTVGSPLFCYIGGEGESYINDVLAGEIVDNAKPHNALIVALEHRFYGKSQPLSDWSTDNLQYLSSQQAQADLAHFIKNISMVYNTGVGVIWGGSYAGAMSAWFRLHHYNLVGASVASSGPINAKLEFYEYDEAVSGAAGETCSDDIRSSMNEVITAYDNDSDKVYKDFQCQKINQTDKIGFLYFLSDAAAYAIQYSTNKHSSPRFHLREKLCEIMSNSSMTGYDKFLYFINYIYDKLGTDCYSFDSNDIPKLKRTTIDYEDGGRQWTWQSCREFGYFQTAPKNNPLRPSLIDLKYHLELCSNVFKIDNMQPNIQFTNDYYGGSDRIHSSRTIFPNGDTDPWRILSYLKDNNYSNSLVRRMIHGTSHCSDLYPASDDDLPDLTAARSEISNYLNNWISQSYEELCPNNLLFCNGQCVDTKFDPNNCGKCNNKVDDSLRQICYDGKPIIYTQPLNLVLIYLGSTFLILSVIIIIIGYIYWRRRSSNLNTYLLDDNA